jgi:GAF domain
MRETKVLSSWKAIAAYLGCGVRTAQRYDADRGLPVRRVSGTTHSTVCAFIDEIDLWVASRPIRSDLGSEALPKWENPNGNSSLYLVRNPEVLRKVLITPELWRRPGSHVTQQRIDAVLGQLECERSGDELNLLEFMVRATLNLCGAHSAGFSTLKHDTKREFFRWDAVVGSLAHAVGGTTPREWSPCGLTLERQSAQLLFYQARYFTYFADAQPPIVEGLILPVYLKDEPLGTLWIVSHDEILQFNAEHVRVMNEIAHRCADAIWQRRQENQCARDSSAQPIHAGD